MATISKNGERQYDPIVEIILESDSEIDTLPTTIITEGKQCGGYSALNVGSTAFCPSTGNAFMLTNAGWIKL
jgi:hypothetical protein